MPEGGGYARPFGNGRQIVGGSAVEPAPPDAEHRRQSEPVVSIVGSNAPRGTEAHLCERRRVRLQGRDPARCFGGEELEAVEAEIEAAHDVAGGANAGQKSDS